MTAMPVANSATIKNTKPVQSALSYLQNIVVKNLKFQHYWKDLQCFEAGQSLYGTNVSINGILESYDTQILSRPIILGTPAEPLYMLDPTAASNARDKETTCPTEIVVPSSLRESWSVRDWATLFDSLPDIKDAQDISPRKKRILLAVIADDSTVVYYLVHDGIVKPRQN